jgi:hypothetical protein
MELPSGVVGQPLLAVLGLKPPNGGWAPTQEGVGTTFYR